MKKPLPLPAIAAAVVAALLLAGFLISRAGSSTAEFPAPKIPKTMPKYVFDAMSPADQAKAKAEGYTVSEGPAPANPGAPASAPR